MPAHRAHDERWQRAWAAFVLGTIVVVALGLVAFVLTTSHDPKRSAEPPLLLTEVAPSSTHATTTTAAASTSASTGRSSPHPSPSSSARRASPTPAHTSGSVTHVRTTTSAPTPTQTAVTSAPIEATCPSAHPCIVDGNGSVPPALQHYRRAHGANGVPGIVTSAAQQCALTAGDGPTCARPFAIAVVADKFGGLAVDDIGSGSGNWLLDRQMTAVEIGWAYHPHTKMWVCALIERT